MTCEQCQREFTPAPFHYHQKFCSAECRIKYRRQEKRRQLMAKITFEREWAQWKKDFAKGKTASNLEVSYEKNFKSNRAALC